MNNKFIPAEAKILIFDEKYNYYVSDCNNQEQIDYAIKTFGEPHMYMCGFANWKEMAAAKRCYQHMLSALRSMSMAITKPTAEEIDWFWQKQLEDEHFWNYKKFAAQIARYEETLPDAPKRKEETK